MANPSGTNESKHLDSIVYLFGRVVEMAELRVAFGIEGESNLSCSALGQKLRITSNTGYVVLRFARKMKREPRLWKKGFISIA